MSSHHSVEQWATLHARTLQFVYTIPTAVSGLSSSGLHVLQNAVTNGATITVVNLMTFDYFDGQHHEMATDTETAAGHLYTTLQHLYPNKSPSTVWQMIGVTEMIGIDDYGRTETFTLADGPIVKAWAARKQIAELSFWALQRDNGACPGVKGQDSCSGLMQSTWAFSHQFEPFTS
jgi:hypothetical protein